jgi:hypothetical protein
MDIQNWLRKTIEMKERCFYFDMTFYQLQPEVTSYQKRIFLEDSLIIKGFSVEEIEIGDYKEFLEYLFPDCEIIDCQDKNGGHPDFIIKKGNEELYLEVKVENDGLRATQLNWVVKNKDKNIYTLFIKNKSAIRRYVPSSNANSITNFNGSYDEKLQRRYPF